MNAYTSRSAKHVCFYDLYVNDILLDSSDLGVVPNKDMLFENFEMKDSGEASYVLLIEIIRDQPQKL